MEEQKQSWYLRTWFICLMVSLWPFIMPTIIGLILLFFQKSEQSKQKLITEEAKKILNTNIEEGKRIIGEADKILNINKAEAEHIISEANDKAKRIVTEAEDIVSKANSQAKSIISEAYSKSVSITAEAKVKVQNIDNQIDNLLKDKKQLENELNGLEQEIIVKSVDISCYEGMTSDECKNKLELLKLKQNDFIKSEEALIISSHDAKKVLNNNKKQILRCFNSECNSIIASTTVKNIDSSRAKIKKCFEVLNNIFSTDGLSITYEFLEMKYEELSLIYAYQFKKEEEKEQQKAIREQMVEEEKVRREIEKEKQKLEKEETQFKNEIHKLMGYMQKSKDDVQSQLYIDKIKELEEKLKLLETDKENVLQREQNTRAGFVYVISNVGSFGENIYKIGMTRRLEPMDRIKELGDASVPFGFDVHALIFSDDAPALENILHQTFRGNEVNKINHRKEFFNINLEAVEKVVKENHNATVEFIKIPEANEYRESLKLVNADVA